MNKIKIIKLDIMISVIIISIIFIMSAQLKNNEIENAELTYGKQDIIIRKVQNFKSISFDNIKRYSISKEYVDININSINSKVVYGVELMDIDKNYFDVHSHNYRGDIIKNNNVVIGERLAKYLNVNIGDEIKCKTDNSNFIYRISGVVDNKLYMDNGDKIFLIKDNIVFDSKTNVSVILKDVNKSVNILKNESKYKIYKNDELIKSKKEFSNLTERGLYLVFFIVLFLLSLLILNVIFDRRERERIGVKRILGQNINQLIKNYSTEYFRVSFLYAGISIFIGLLISLLISIIILKKLFISKIDICFLILIFICTIFIVYMSSKIYIKRILRESPLEIINNKINKSDTSSKFYIKISSKQNIFWRYYQVDILKNLFIVFIISISSIYFFKINYTYYLDQVIYQQYKKIEGNDYDFKINVNGTINTNSGINTILYNKIKNDKNIEYVKGSRYSYGVIRLEPNTKYDKKYFYDISTASGYMKDTLNGVAFKDNGNIYFKSEIVGVDENYLKEIYNYIDSGLSKNKIDEDSIFLYIPKLESDNKYKVQYNVGEYIDLYMPINGDTSEYYFRKNKIDDSLTKNRLKIVAILNRPIITSDYYTGDASLVPIMSIKKFNKIVKNDIYRDIKVKYKNTISDEQKKVVFDKIYNELNIPGVNTTSYIEERNKDFESINQTIKLKNIVLISIILLGVLLTGINLQVSINKRKNDYSLLNIIGLSNKKIHRYIFVENFINYVLSTLIVIFFSTIEQKKIFKEYADILLNKNINDGLFLIAMICASILISGLVSINIFKFIVLKIKSN